MSEEKSWSSDFAVLRQLLLDFVSSAANEIDVQLGGLHLRARKGTGPVARPAPAAPAPTVSLAPTVPTLSIASPLTGVVYLSPTPQAPAFVNVGDVVEVGQVVALIEAMKVFNEIRSEHAGRVIRVLVNGGDVVETGQPLLELAEE